MAAEAKTACVAGNVVGCRDPVSLRVAINSGTYFDHFSGNLVAKDQRGFFDPIPFHYIAAADTARLYPNQEFTLAYPGDGYLLYPDVLVIVVHSHAHLSCPLDHL
jgi:hypothetical protein